MRPPHLPRSSPVRVATTLLAMAALVVPLLGASASAAGSVGGSGTDGGVELAAQTQAEVRIIEVSGLLDGVLADFLLSELDRAEADDALAVVLQVNSLGAVVDDERFKELASRLRDSPIQTAFWVGPSGSAAEGGTAQLSGVVDLVGVAGGSRIGDAGPSRLPAGFEPAFGSATERLEDQVVFAAEALDLGISDAPDESLITAFPDGDVIDDPLIAIQSTLPTFLVQLQGYDLVENAEGDQIPSVSQQFLKLPITSQLFHTVASPEITYLFFAGGLALMLFELYTAGVGIAGLIGLGMTLSGTYGLATLPFRPIGVAMIVLSFLAMAVDIQTNIPRAYTVAGLILFVLGTFFIWDGITMSWVTRFVGIVGAGLYAYLGMPTMVRTRFSSPIIGRSWMVGSKGTTTGLLGADQPGEVRIGDARWPALAESGTIPAGKEISVTATRGVNLIVEPAL